MGQRDSNQQSIIPRASVLATVPNKISILYNERIPEWTKIGFGISLF